jgi:hypothetical protein
MPASEMVLDTVERRGEITRFDGLAEAARCVAAKNGRCQKAAETNSRG